jgi:hypothetical protein
MVMGRLVVFVAALKVKGEIGKAARLCEAFTNNGYKDWFLPSQDELKLMYKNLNEKGLGSFINDWYWSSSHNKAVGITDLDALYRLFRKRRGDGRWPPRKEQKIETESRR